MTRIYTNVPAMIGRAHLAKNMAALQTSLERLSTGFKINSGKDDPAGLIASEMLRSDIAGIKMAIRNTERGNMMIATAESALNEVTNLLNDIRGLVTEAASTGTMTNEMIYANQLQVDASLDAIDRIAAQTTFMGTKLLDGSLDFELVGIDRNNLKGLAVNQAIFGANQTPLGVSINVRGIAEKAELYYNQPGLADTIVLQWGGNYGYDMETFEKGATVAEIAEIINKRADGTGVIAEVGSDALVGLLYVSSLGYDNDMIIKAGMAGLNAGNVEIKYLKGSSDGIQVRYEEPLYEGAPAKILVYLQTEAYEAAFANDIDTSWTIDKKTGQLVPMKDNNALDFKANIEGAQYNNASIFFVDGSLTDPLFYTDRNPTGTAGMPYAYYSDAGNSSRALFGNAPGTGPGGVNNTAYGFGLLADEYFQVATRAVGAQYNNVNIQFVAASPGDTFLSGRNAAAYYLEQLDVWGNVVDKTLTVYYNNSGNTTLQDVEEALRLERHMENGSEVRGTFEVRANLGSGRRLNDVNLFAAGAGQTYKSNTHNSGGAEGSLFIVMPPDGKMPKKPDIPEQMGVTVKPIGDGLYLAHKTQAWDNYTFEFTQYKNVAGNTVTVNFDASSNTLKISADGGATYDDILAALNGSWSGKPASLVGDDLFWSDAVGNPLTPNVPRGLAATVDSGVLGRSNLPVATLAEGPMYLKHTNQIYDDWTIVFEQVDKPGPSSVSVNGDISGRRIVITYNQLATYDEIVGALNAPMWASGSPPIISPTEFSWIHTDGTPFTGSTTSVNSATQVNPGLFMRHDNVIWDGYTIVFTKNTGAPIGTPMVGLNGKIVTVTYEDGVHTYGDILTTLNTMTPPGIISPLVWSDSTRTDVSATWAATIFAPAATNIPLGYVTTTGTETLAGSHLQTISTNKMVAKTNFPVGDTFYIAHGDPQWDGVTFNFARTGTTGGSVSVSFDSATSNVSVLIDNDTTYDQILAALNDPDGTHGTPGWHLLGTTTPLDLPVVTHPVTQGLGSDALWWVNASTSTVIPGVPTSLVASTASGVYQPFAYSVDGRSQIVGDGLYLQHTDKKWDNLNITFVDSGGSHAGATPPATRTAPPIRVNFDGKTVNVIVDTDATYEDILFALNNPFSTTANPPWDPTGVGGDLITPPGLGTAWTGWDILGSTPLSLVPPANDMHWVDGHGMVLTICAPRPGLTGVLPGTTDLKISHTDSKWDDYGITFAPGAAGTAFGISLNVATKQIIVSYDGTAPPTYQNMLDAINGTWSGKPTGMGAAFSWDPASTDNPTVRTLPIIGSASPLNSVTYVPIFNNPSIPLNKTITTGAVWVDITANDIAAIFDLDKSASRGSERAAGLFTVTTTVDNDGTGLMRLYNYWIDQNGKEVRAGDPNATTYIQTKTGFEKVFQKGVTGGNVITTGAELVTALNNSAYWGMTMCHELIAELAQENAKGVYYDASNPPVITAELAPTNHGYFPVGTFEEVAYYGNPNEGTALQFLGGYNSPNIRFSVDGPNSKLYITRGPDTISFSQAVLTAQDSGASLTITAAAKGAAYDDVQFIFKRMSEDAKGMASPDRRDGYVEYDPGLSFAYAQATFKDATTGLSIPNSAFYITSTERGGVYNNVDILMRIDEYAAGPDPVVVTFDPVSGQLRVSVSSTFADKVTTNDIIQAINKASVPFQAELSFSQDPLNNGTGKFDTTGLSGRYASIGNTGNTGGHAGAVTVWLADANPGPGAPGVPGSYMQPTTDDIVRLINSDPKVSTLFTAKAYNTQLPSDGKQIDFVKDGPIVSKGGLVEKGIIEVHLATDKVGNVTTTAADLVKYWDELGVKDPDFLDNISISLVRPPGAIWDECNDPYGKGLLSPSISKGECDEWIINDIQFVGWNDDAKQQQFVARRATGIMTSQRGINSSYQLTAKNIGPEWDGWTIEYINNDYLTGRFSDNLVDGANKNPCDDPVYSGLERDECGNYKYPNQMTEKGMGLVYDEVNKKIIVSLKFGVTTAKDIEELIEADPRTRNRWQIDQLGNGSGLVDKNDNTLLTTGGVKPPGELNGAKLLFGSDATDYYLIFRSREYGSDQFVDVRAYNVDGSDTTFTVSNKDGKNVEKAFGKDVDALINGIHAVGKGLNVSLNTAGLSLNFGFSEKAGTTEGYSTQFTVNGGGATFQVGPDVVSRQQITLGIRSINTVLLGGSTGVLNQLRSGHDADLSTNTNKAFRIVDEALLAVTSIRGRLGTLQKATLQVNIDVLNDTLVALTEAESQIRDTDFAEESSNLTRAQILVQANMNTLGIANQIPNYMLSLLGR